MKIRSTLAGLPAKVAFNLRYHARQSHPVRSLAADLLARTHGSRLVTYRHAGSRLRLRRAGLSRLLWVDPGCRLDGEIFIERFLRPGETFVDVGANIGVHTLLAARIVGPTGRVRAIEAHPGTFRALEENIRLNDAAHVTAVCAAAGPAPGQVHFSDRTDDDWNQVQAEGALTVAQQPLDELCQGLGRIALLKIDVEGYELPCLRGAAEVLARTDCVLLEYWREHTRHFGYSLADLMAWLGRWGFSAHVLDETATRIALRPLAHDAAEPDELLNLVFVRDPVWLERVQPAAESP